MMTVEEQAVEVEAEITRLAKYTYTGSIGPSPKGPPPLSETARVIADAIRLAVLRERAECAKVASDMADQMELVTTNNPGFRHKKNAIGARLDCARGIAASITARGAA